MALAHFSACQADTSQPHGLKERPEVSAGTRLAVRQGMSPLQTARCRGMSLIEVLIVVAIMTLIAGGVAVAAYQHFVESKLKTALMDARAIRGAIKASWIVTGREDCPSVEDLIANGVLDADNRTTDPWNQPWRISCEGGEISVSSDGPDGAESTEDDIRVPPLGRKPSAAQS